MRPHTPIHTETDNTRDNDSRKYTQRFVSFFILSSLVFESFIVRQRKPGRSFLFRFFFLLSFVIHTTLMVTISSSARRRNLARDSSRASHCQRNSFRERREPFSFRDELLSVETLYRKRGSCMRSYRYLQGARRFKSQSFIRFILSPYDTRLDRPSSFPLGRGPCVVGKTKRGEKKEGEAPCRRIDRLYH